MKRPLLPAGLAVSAVAAVAAISGCGGSTATSTAKPAAASTPQAASVGTRSTPLGTVLVDAQGRTLYLFEKDKGSTSSCYGGCAGAWPPLTTGAKPDAAGGASAGKLGSAKRSDGTTIVTYGGHPLYTYVGDAAPGDTKGQGLDQFGAEWYVLAPSGAKIDEG